jgi:hypothetical protein
MDLLYKIILIPLCLEYCLCLELQALTRNGDFVEIFYFADTFNT